MINTTIKILSRKTFNLGKIAYAPYVKTKRCDVEVIISINESEGFPPYISFMGGFWNSRHTDYYTCGQCFSEINENKDAFSEENQKLWDTLLTLWMKYHLHNLYTITDKEDIATLKSLGIDITVA